MSIASRQVVLSRKEYEEYEAMVDERNALKAKLDASERANAQMRSALERWSEAPSEDANRQAFAALSSDAGRDYVPKALLEMLEEEIEGHRREVAYVKEKLMRPGDHSLPEAVDRWVNNYVPKEQLARAQLCCELQKHQLDLAKPAADALVDAAWRKGMGDAAEICVANCDYGCREYILAARDAQKESTK